MTRSSYWFALVALAPIAVVAACDDAVDFNGGSFELPDAGNVTFDATTSGNVDASDEPDVVDAGDAADAADEAAFPGLIGSVGGVRHDDRCPAGQLAIGLAGGTVASGFYIGALSELTTLCGTPVPPQGASTDVSITPGATVPADEKRGITTAVKPLVAVSCGPNQVLVGLAGSSISKNFPPPRGVVASARLRCATLSYAGGAYTLGAITDGSTLGTSATAAGPFDCAAGEVATGSYVQSGEILDGLGPRCERIDRAKLASQQAR